MPRRQGESTSRSFTFTWNNYTEDDVAYLKERIPCQCSYGVFGREVGEKERTPHLQGMVHFVNAKTKSAANAFFKNNFNEFMKAKDFQAAAYCRKDGDFFEYGERPMNNYEKGQAGKRKYDEACELAEQGRIKEIPAPMRVRYYRTWKQMNVDHIEEQGNLPEPCGIWYWGVPGAGKTTRARDENPDRYMKPVNKWWDGYRHQHTVIMDEMDPSHSSLGTMIKLAGDKVPFLVDTKGGTMMIRPKRFIVCSNFSPEECFGHCPITLRAIRRRFTVTHFPHEYGKTL